jgi:hypothetical protein
MVVFVLNSWLTPARLKPRKLFPAVSGTDMAKLPIGAEYTSGPEEFPPDHWRTELSDLTAS